MDEFETAPRKLTDRYRDPKNESQVLVLDPESLAGYSSEFAQPGDENLPVMPPDEYQTLVGIIERAEPRSAPMHARQGPPRAPMKPKLPETPWPGNYPGSPTNDPKAKFLDSVKSRARGNMAQDMRKALAPVPQPVHPLPTPQTGGAPADPALEDMEAALGAMGPDEAPIETAGSRPLTGDPGDGTGPMPTPPPPALAQGPGTEDAGLEGLDEDELQRLLAEA